MTASQVELGTSRIEAFSDGVLAVIITITAFEIKVPGGPTWHAFRADLPHLLVYLLSFSYVGIYWNNHHHLLRATERINGAVMWANLHLLFWLSLVPLLTEWVSEFPGMHLPVCAYGVAALGAAIAYTILTRAIIRCNGTNSLVARAIGNDRKGYVSLAAYILAVGGAWITPWISYALYASVSIMWFVPDRRFDPASGREGRPAV